MPQCSLLQVNLALPGAFGQAQGLDQVLPPLTTPLLLPHVAQQLLPPMYQYPQVSLIHLVLPAPTLQEVCQCPNLCSQNGNLHLRRTRVWPCAWHCVCLGQGNLISRSKRIAGARPWLERLVCVVAAKGLDTTLNVNPSAVLRATVRNANNASEGIDSIGVFCSMRLCLLLCLLRIQLSTVWFSKWSGKLI